MSKRARKVWSIIAVLFLLTQLAGGIIDVILTHYADSVGNFVLAIGWFFILDQLLGYEWPDDEPKERR